MRKSHHLRLCSVQNKKGLYIQGLRCLKTERGYWHQVLIITIASPKNYHESLKEDDGGNQIEENDQAIEPTMHLPNSKREAKQHKMNFWKLSRLEWRAAIHVHQRKHAPERKRYVSRIHKAKLTCDCLDVFRNAMVGSTVATHCLVIEPDRRSVK